MNREITTDLASILTRVEVMSGQIAEMHALLIEQRSVKEKYTTAEVAEIVGKTEYTVREWCRFGRIRAEKRACGRGKAQEWAIAHDELMRLRNEGLLPVSRK